MENKIIELGPIKGSVTVSVIRKNIKNVHLNVFRDFIVVISVPKQVPDEWINDFLQSRAKWIDTQIIDFAEADITNILELFHVLSDGTHGEAGRYESKKLAQVKKRVEQGINFLCEISA